MCATIPSAGQSKFGALRRDRRFLALRPPTDPPPFTSQRRNRQKRFNGRQHSRQSAVDGEGHDGDGVLADVEGMRRQAKEKVHAIKQTLDAEPFKGR